MDTIKTEGVILQSVPFKEKDTILTVFTPEFGLVKLFYKGNRRGNINGSLAIGDFLVTKARSDLWKCLELSVLNSHLPLRNSLDCLEAAFSMAKSILHSQSFFEPAPLLYKLFILYIQKLPLVSNPFCLAASFQLKVLRHEGLISFTRNCSICKKQWEEAIVFEGEIVCKEHGERGFLFTQSEMQFCEILAFSTSLSPLSSLNIPKDFHEKIQRVFDQITQK